MLRASWAMMKFAGRWLGPALILLAAWLVLFPPAPFGDVSAMPALAGGIVSAIAWLAGRGAARRRSRGVLAATALIGLCWFAWSNWQDRQGYTRETVRFENRGARLVGTLYLPDRRGPHGLDRVPGIVWVHGSGPQTRMLNAPYASHFARAGYAVLMFDKRGVGESGGHFASGDGAIAPANIDLLASDASAALALLARRPEVRADAVGFVGVSQAGWITPRAAVLNGHAAFMVLLSGPATSTYTQMRYERFHLGPPAGGQSAAMAFKAFGQGNIPDGMTPDEADVQAQKTAIALPFADFDPMNDLRALDIPGLWLLGDRDWMVPSGPTARNLDGLRKLGKPYRYRHIPGAIHGMLLGPKGLVLDALDGWLAEVTAPGRGAPAPKS